MQPSLNLPLPMRPSPMIQGCMAALSTGTLDQAPPFCKAWALALIKNRGVIEESKENFAYSDEVQSSKPGPEIKVKIKDDQNINKSSHSFVL